MDQISKIKLSRQVMLISGIFCIVVATLLLANFLQLKKSDPLESQVIESLVNRLESDPDNEELKNEIRNYDLLARKAYFTGTWQVNTGALLLLFGGIVFALALKIYTDIQQKINPPAGDLENIPSARLISHRWLLITGAVVFTLALLAAYLTEDELGNYTPMQNAGAISSPDEQEIELIRITDSTGFTTGEALNEDSVGNLQNNLTISEEAIDELAVEKPSIKYAGAEDFKKNQGTFRGLFGHGISYSKNIPTDWDGASGKNIKWKVALTKPGYNSPVIWADKIFIAGADKDAQIVSCFENNSGRLLWEKEVTGIPGSPSTPPKVTDDTGLAAPTMAVDGNNVYAIFGTGDIVAFDMNGNKVWARNLGVPKNHYGHSSSLQVWKDKVIVQYDTGNGGRMLAVNVATGETVWDVKRQNQISWSSPILLQKDGKMQIITTSDPNIAGHDLETGKELWKVAGLSGEVAPSAAYADGLVFGTNEYAQTVAVKPENGSEIVWEDNTWLSEVSSPVAYKGLLFLATSYGDLVCQNALNGEIYWELSFNDGFYSSPMIAEDKLYIIDMGGVMHILKVAKTAEIINEPELGEKAFAIPAFADGRIYLRSNTALYCIEVK